MGAELLIFFPELSSQRRFFIKKNKSKKSQPNNKSVFQQAHAAKQQSLAEVQERHGNIHRIADITIQPGNHESLGRTNRCGRPQSLVCETSEGVEKDGSPGRDRQRPDHAEEEKTEQRWGEAPVTNRPGDLHRDRPRCYHQKDR